MGRVGSGELGSVVLLVDELSFGDLDGDRREELRFEDLRSPLNTMMAGYMWYTYHMVLGI